jgi:hypothetical protein
MGNAISRSLGLREGGSSTIDGGTTRLQADNDPAGESRRRKIEYDVKIVERLIRGRRLAPFYENIEEVFTETPSRTSSDSLQEDTSEAVENVSNGEEKDASTSTLNSMENQIDAAKSATTALDSSDSISKESDHCKKKGGGRKSKKEMRLERVSRMETLLREFLQIREAECPICFIVSCLRASLFFI